MNKKYVKLNYLLSLFLILTGIIYFFASNWQKFDRLSKVGLSLGLMLLFYAGSFLIRKLIKQHYFLSHWLMVSGSIGFGITLSLLGQIYNWHADSYLIFALWLIPILFFSFITKYQVFYYFSYVLFNMTFWFYMNPSSVIIDRTEIQESFIYFGFALINFLFFYLTNRILHSPSIKYNSFIVFHVIMLYLSQTEVFANASFHHIYALVYFVFLVFLIIFYTKKVQNKIILSITISFTALFVFTKILIWLLSNASSSILTLSILGVIGLIAGSVFLVNFMNRKLSTHNNKWLKPIRNYAISSITFIASTIGAASIIGLLYLIGGFDETLIFFLGVAFILGGFFVAKKLPTVKYSLMLTGYIISGATSFFVNNIIYSFFLLVLVFLIVMSKSQTMSVVTYLFLNLLASGKFFSLVDSAEVTLVIFSISNFLFYILLKRNVSLKHFSLIICYSSFLALTFIDYNTINYVIYNLIFFIGVTFMVYWTKKSNKKVDFYLSLIAWFGFVLTKYYDIAWDLIHKSIIMIFLGIIFAIIAKKMDKSLDQSGTSFVDTKKKMLLLTISLQIAIVLSLSFYHENILNKGEEIKLELQPLDPRSLIQGDYVDLSYGISNIEVEGLHRKEKVEILLRMNENGVYQYADNYKHDGKWKKIYKQEKNDVIINGRYNGYDGIYYGIENFFIPEGTGEEIEEKAKFALVKVGKNQNALVLKLLEE